MQRGVHGRPLSLVLGKHLHADLGLALVEGAHDAVGPEGLDHFDEHAEEAEYRVGRGAVGGGHRGRDRVEGAMHQRVAVDYSDDTGFCLFRALLWGGCFRHQISNPFACHPHFSDTGGQLAICDASLTRT